MSLQSYTPSPSISYHKHMISTPVGKLRNITIGHTHASGWRLPGLPVDNGQQKAGQQWRSSPASSTCISPSGTDMIVSLIREISENCRKSTTNSRGWLLLPWAFSVMFIKSWSSSSAFKCLPSRSLYACEDIRAKWRTEGRRETVTASMLKTR